MTVITKKSKTYVYVSLGNLDLSMGEVHCSSRNNHVFKEKEFK